MADLKQYEAESVYVDVMYDRLPLNDYQLKKLKEVFTEMPTDEVMVEMKDLIPPCEDVPSFLTSMARGGSLAFNALRQELEDTSLYHRLSSHGESEIFRWVWLCSWTGQVLKKSAAWYACEVGCYERGNQNLPDYDTFDGPGAPYPILCVESVPVVLCEYKKREASV